MSIISSIYAEKAERVRKEWVEKLKSATTTSRLNDSQKLILIKEIIDEMDAFYFSE